MAANATVNPLDRDPFGFRKEGRDLLAAVAAGSIVAMPLLFTMETWWRGMTMSPARLLALLAAIFLVNFLFNFLSGFREGALRLADAAEEAVTAVGLGIVLAAAILALIGELTLADSRQVMAGKVLLEAAVVSIGVSFANTQIRGRSRRGENGKPKNEAFLDLERLQMRADLRDFSAAAAGATVFSLNIAPTEEVQMVAAQLSDWQHLILIAASLLLCYVIMFATGFEEHHVYVESLFQSPAVETLVTCAVAYLVAGALLYFMGFADPAAQPRVFASHIAVLGLPACVGGAAGRLIA